MTIFSYWLKVSREMTVKGNRARNMAAESTRALKIFYCYARKDKALRDELENHLEPLRRSGQVITWHDREIQPGMEWKREIDTHLNTSDIVLLLISPNFIHSDYCYGVEMRRALERHEAGQTRIIPIILRPVDWKSTPISELQVLPTEGRPITKWRNRDDAFQDVVKGIRTVVAMLRSQGIHEISKTHTLSKQTKEVMPVSLSEDAEKKSHAFDSSLQQLLTPHYPQQPHDLTSVPRSTSPRSIGPVSLYSSSRKVILITTLILLLTLSGLSFFGIHNGQVALDNANATITALTNTNDALQKELTPFISMAPTQFPGLETNLHQFILTVDANGLLNDSQQAIDAVKYQVQTQPFLRGRSVGLAIVYGGAPDVSQITNALTISQRVYAVFHMLGQEKIIFTRASYYNPLYLLGNAFSKVRVDVYLYRIPGPG